MQLLWWPKYVGGVFGTLRYPHLILPYLAYYGHLASQHGGPWCSPIPWWCNKKHLQVPEPPIYVKMIGLTVLSVLPMGSPHTKPPPYDFLNLYGACLQAPRTPKMKYAVRLTRVPVNCRTLLLVFLRKCDETVSYHLYIVTRYLWVLVPHTIRICL